jgi:hypothetical protein
MKRVGARSSKEPTLPGREIIHSHLPEIRPCSAVRNVVLQSSLTMLEEEGHYERYVKLMDPKKLEELRSTLAPGWIPIALAHAHYQACDDLGLTEDEIARLGQRIGLKLHETMLVHSGKRNPGADFDLWEATGALYRTYARTYEGGSLQVAKLGPKDKLLELKGFSLSRHRYYRIAQLHGIASGYQSFGVRLETKKIVSYNPTADELTFRFTWR